MGNSKSRDPEPEPEENENDEVDNEKYGKPHNFDPNFNGPIHNRSCTDVLCLILFLIFFLAFLAVGVWAFIMGDPRVLLYPTDSQGNICGEGAFQNRSKLFFFDLIDCFTAGPAAIFALGCPTKQVCVSECPKTFWTWIQTTVQAEEVVKRDMICDYGIDPLGSSKTVQDLVDDGDCAAYYLRSSELLGRCVPSVITEAVNSIGYIVTTLNVTLVNKDGAKVNGTALGKLFDQSESYLSLVIKAHEYGTLILQDVQASWWLILIGLGLAMVLSLIWILLMRCIAAPMVWITLLAFVGLFAFGTYYCFSTYVELKDDPSAQGGFILTTNLDYYLHLKNTWLAFGIIAVSFLAITIIILLVLRKRVLISIELVKQASKAVGVMPSTLFWPIVPFILHVLVLAYWLASALYLASTARGTLQLTNSTEDAAKSSMRDALLELPCDSEDNTTAGRLCKYIKYGGDEYVLVLQVFQLFMWFWLMFFVTALGEATLAGAFASYYWAWDKPKDVPTCATLSAFGRTLRYHVGSLAFGALIIALVRLVRTFLAYLDGKLKGSPNKCAVFCVKCCMCCFWCLEKILKYINKNAYIMIAVYGNNFCSSAKNAFNLLLRNIIRVAVVDKVTDFLVFIGKMMIVGGIGVLSFYFFRGEIPVVNTLIEQPRLNYYLIPVLIVCIGSYVVASGFFGVYSMGVDTLFLSFLDDVERNDGSAEKPYYMNSGLMEILGKKNVGSRRESNRT